MALQTANTLSVPQEVFENIRNLAQGAKGTAGNYLTQMQGGNVDSNFVFRMLDQLNQFITSFNTWSTAAGLNAYATAQGYSGTLTSDMSACVTAAQNCIAWVVANFPASGGFLQAESLNADGTRTARSFTSANTLGLQTNLQAFIATIG